MATTRERAVTALQTLITNAVASSFTGNTSAGVQQITGIASTAGLFAGLPIVGGTVPDGALIQSVDSATQVTATIAPTGNATGVSFLSGFRTVARRVLPWNKLTAQPALFLVVADEEREVKTGLPPKRTLLVELRIYTDVGKNSDFAPGIALDNFADAIESALAGVPPSNVQNLGGLVAWARIEGKIEFYPGDLGSQALMIVPVKILLP